MMKGQKVRCRSCGKVLYETTEHYDPDIPLNGSMLQLVEPYRSYNWQTYDGALGDVSTTRFQMLCVWCCGYVATENKLTFVDEPKDDNIDEPIKDEPIKKPDGLLCPECGKLCRSNAGLVAHMRTHKK